MRARSVTMRAQAIVMRARAVVAAAVPRVLAATLLATLASATLSETLAAAATTEPRARIEARSSDLLAVGTVQGDRMAIHLTRVIDNAPVGNAGVTVTLRGITHPAVAEADGSYSVETPDLSLPGAAAVEFLVTWSGKREELTGTLEALADKGETNDKGSSRQLGWWVLNFVVCIGFLWLWSRRKSSDGAEK